MTEKIRTLLADPESAARIAQIASSITGGGTAQTQPADAAGENAQTSVPASAQPEAAPAMRPADLPFSGDLLRRDPRIDLLRALRPLIAREKQARVDDLIRIATVASLLGNAGRHRN